MTFGDVPKVTRLMNGKARLEARSPPSTSRLPCISCLMVQVALWIIPHFCLVGPRCPVFLFSAPNLHMLEHKIPHVPKRKVAAKPSTHSHDVSPNKEARSRPARCPTLSPRPSAFLPKSPHFSPLLLGLLPSPLLPTPPTLSIL